MGFRIEEAYQLILIYNTIINLNTFKYDMCLFLSTIHYEQFEKHESLSLSVILENIFANLHFAKNQFNDIKYFHVLYTEWLMFI